MRHHGDSDAVARREVTLALVKYRTPLAAASLPRAINSDTALVAASPAYETARLLTVFGAGVDLIRAFAWLLVAASTLMLFVALAQTLDERRYDLAIMRALGASRAQVAFVLLAESLFLAAAGTLLGTRPCARGRGGHTVVAAAGGAACGRGPPLHAGGVGRGRARDGRGYNCRTVAGVAGLSPRCRRHACRGLKP